MNKSASPFDGDRLSVGANAVVEAGDLILHVDQSSKSTLRIAVPDSDGDGVLILVQAAPDPLSLAPLARNLITLSPSDRVAKAAQLLLADPEPFEDAAVRAYYENLAKNKTSPKMDLANFSTAELMAELQRRGA